MQLFFYWIAYKVPTSRSTNKRNNYGQKNSIGHRKNKSSTSEQLDLIAGIDISVDRLFAWHRNFSPLNNRVIILIHVDSSHSDKSLAN